jgi:hypothetical protein
MARAPFRRAWLHGATGAVAAVVISTTLVTAASAHGGDPTKVHSCVETVSGGIRIVGPDDACGGGEQALDWS